MWDRLRRLASLTEEMEQHAPDLPGIFFSKTEALSREVELFVGILFLSVGVTHVLVDVVHVCTAVVAIEGAAEGGAVKEIAKILMEVVDEETAIFIS
jgi:hypothetical protein